MSAITAAYLQADSDRYSLWQNEQLQNPKRRNCKPIERPFFTEGRISVFIAGSQENVDEEIGNAKNAIKVAITDFNANNNIIKYPFECQTCDNKPYTDMVNPQLKLYDKMINNADYFIFVVKDKIGPSTRHEMEEALKKRKILGVVMPSIIGFVFDNERANSIEDEVKKIFSPDSDSYLYRYVKPSELKKKVKDIIEEYHRSTLGGNTENIKRIRKETIKHIDIYNRSLTEHPNFRTPSFREILKFLFNFLFTSSIRQNGANK